MTVIISVLIFCLTWVGTVLLRHYLKQKKRVSSQQVTDVVMDWIVEYQPEMETPYELFEKIERLWN